MATGVKYVDVENSSIDFYLFDENMPNLISGEEPIFGDYFQNYFWKRHKKYKLLHNEYFHINDVVVSVISESEFMGGA
jgi:hypothetical protein